MEIDDGIRLVNDDGNSNTTLSQANNSLTKGKAMTIQLTNRRGETVTSELTQEQVLASFGEHAKDSNWLWFYLYQQAEEILNKIDMANGLLTVERRFFWAKGQGLKSPKIQVIWNDIKWQIAYSKNGNLMLKNAEAYEPGQQNFRAAVYRGSIISANGDIWQPHGHRKWNEAERDFLDRLNNDPVGFLAEAGKGMEACCYCNKALSDDRSKAVGYGKICASRWGLPWGKDESDWLAESTDPLVPAGFPQPRNPEEWMIIADYHEMSGDVDSCNAIRTRIGALKLGEKPEINW